MKKKLKDLSLENKAVLLRVDFNTPMNKNEVSDNTRLVSSLPTLKALLAKNCRVVAISHLKRPDPIVGVADHDKNVAELPEINASDSLFPVAKALQKLLPGVPVKMAPHLVGKEVKEAMQTLAGGEILLLENIRLHVYEKSKDLDKRLALAKWLAGGVLGGFDFFINDAFGSCHRAHASTEAIATVLPSAMGLLVEKEINYFQTILEAPPKPAVLILGGAKVSSKLPIIRRLIDTVDHVLIGGGMSYTFLRAKGLGVGHSLLEEGLVGECQALLRQYGEKIVLPSDVLCGQMTDGKIGDTLTLLPTSAIPTDQGGLDIGEQTLQQFIDITRHAKLILWNGPVGVFEDPRTAGSTMALAKHLATLATKDATVVVGGGETAQAAKMSGMQASFSHISTGGGATLEMLQGKVLPGIASIADR